MAANTVVRISVVADGHETIVKLPNTVYDGTLQKSLISKTGAYATHGSIQPKASVTLVDNRGKKHASNATITLRWYYDSGLQTFQETFYIVDGLPRPGGGEWDAMLRRGVERSPEQSIPQAYPYVKSPPREKDPQPGIPLDRQVRYKNEKEQEAQRVRKNIDKKPGPKP